MVVPAKDTKGLPGKRVEPYRAGITMTMSVGLI
jgi:hypothetical protein